MGPKGLCLCVVLLHALIDMRVVHGDNGPCPDGAVHSQKSQSCYIPVDVAVTWDQAAENCDIKGGRLAITRSNTEREKLEQIASRRNWDSVWMGASGEGHAWLWEDEYDYDYLQYQGCYEDDPEEPDLDRRVTGPTNTERCVARCYDIGTAFASVQFSEENEVICRCGDTFGGYRRAPLDQCKKPCPGNKGKIPFCGSIERQMVFLTVAKEDNFMQAAGEVNSWAQGTGPGDCAALVFSDPAEWQQHQCNSKHSYICQHTTYDQSQCQGRGYRWVYNPPICVSIHNKNATWFRARESCLMKEGMLLVIKPRHLRDISTLVSDMKSWWIGLTLHDWHLTDGGPMVAYNGWANFRQPAYQGLLEGAMCLAAKRNDDYKWSNRPCDQNMYFFCELDPADIPEADITEDMDPDDEYEEPDDQLRNRPNPPQPPPSRPPPRNDNQIIIPAAIGAGVGITVVLLIIGAICACRKCRHKENTSRELSRSANRGPLPSVPENSKSYRKSRQQKDSRKPRSKSHQHVSSNNERAASNRYVTSDGAKIPRGEDNGGYVMHDPPMKILNHMSVIDPEEDGEYDYIDHPKAAKAKSRESKPSNTYQSLKSKQGSVKHVYADMPKDSEGVLPPEDEYFVPMDPYV